jgi:hypothetical protein
MRLSWLRDFAAIPPGQDQPLNQFTSRTHGTSQIVGYHKAAMLFFMLRDRLGRERFDAGLRQFWEREQFKTASWDDLRRAFEAASGESLESFFKPWLSRPGAPEIGMVNAECSASGKGYRVQLLLTQSAVPYQLRVPLTVQTAADDEAAIIELTGERANFELTTQARPEAVILDPEFRLFRRLGRHEAQPILRDVMVNSKTATIIAGGDAAFAAAAASLAQQLMDYPAKPVNLPQGDAPVLLIGVHFAVDAWLAANGWPARPPEVGRNGSVQAWSVRRGDGTVAVVISAVDAGSLAAATRPLPHYGRMSYLVFDGSEVVIKGVWPTQPQTVTVRMQ